MRIFKHILVAAALVCTLACFSACGKSSAEYTLTFVTHDGRAEQTVSARGGEQLSKKAPPLSDTEDWYFGGWYADADFATPAPTETPSADATYHARWYVRYTIARELQSTDLTTYEAGESVTAEQNRDAAVPEAVTQALATPPTGFVLQGAAPTLPTSGKDRTLTLRYDRARYTLTYDANAPGQTVTGTMPSETVYYGVEHALSDNGFSVRGYRFLGWALAPDGELVGTVTPSGATTVYALWQKPIEDRFGGGDLLYLSDAEPESVTLVRGDLEKKGSYNPATGVFSFEREDGGTLVGKIVGDTFFYLKSLWQEELTGENGEKILLSPDGTAKLTQGAFPISGTWSLDPETGYFVFESAGTQIEFVIEDRDGVLSFVLGGTEIGWYALETEDGYGYDLLYLDGFGRMRVYAVSPESPDYEPLTDSYGGTYERDGDVWVADYAYGIYTSSFPFKLTEKNDLPAFDGVPLKGTYVFGDYRGTFLDIDTDAPMYLDGFGHGTFGSAEQSGTYEIVTDSWLVDNYPTPGEYQTSVVVFTVDRSLEQHRLAIYGDNLFIEVTADFYGRYDFETVPTSIYPGSSGEVAFLYFDGYTIYAQESYPGSFNDAAVWFGSNTPKYSTGGYTEADLPLYDWRDDGAVFVVDAASRTYRYESTREDVSFEFQITDEGKIRWQVTDKDAVFLEENGEKLWVDTCGVAWYQVGGAAARRVEFGMNSFLHTDRLDTEEASEYGWLVLCTFYVNGEYRSFTYTAPGTQVGFDGTLTDLKPVDFVASIGTTALMIVYKDKTAAIGIDLSAAGGVGYWFALTGTVATDGDIRTLTLDGEPPVAEDPDETADYKAIWDRFDELRFKLGASEDGIFESREEDGIVHDISCNTGRLVTDGFGAATLTIGGAAYECIYIQEDSVLYLTYRAGNDVRDWYVLIAPDEEFFLLAGAEAGVYYALLETDVDQSNMAILNGDGRAYGYYEGAMYEGSYAATGKVLEVGGLSFAEYEFTVTVAGEEQPVSFEAIVSLASTSMRIGTLYYREVGALDGHFFIEDKNGVAIGSIFGDGYTPAEFDDGPKVSGTAYRGDSEMTPRTDADGLREFTVSDTGRSVLFLGEDGSEHLLDFVEGKENTLTLRTLDYGVFARYADGAAADGDTLTLDGYGKALLSADGDETEAFYETSPDIPYAFRLFDDEGKTLFVFDISVIDNSDVDADPAYGFLYVYRTYRESTANLYINTDWTMLVLDGFGGARYVDEYGVVTTYEAIPVDDTTVLLCNNPEADDMLVTLGNGTFARSEREFVVSEEGTLLAYYGKGGDIRLPDEAIRIAAGVFDGVTLGQVDFNNVEVIEAHAFDGIDLSVLAAPNLRIIGERAFAGRGGVDGFETVDLPAIEEIGEAAFINRTELERVTLGASLVSIGQQAFASTGASTGVLIVDVTAIADPSAVDIDPDAFLALNTETLRVRVTDVAAANAVLASDWPQKAKDGVAIWTSGETYPETQFLVSLTDGALYEMREGVVTKVSAGDEDAIVREIAALYALSDNTLSVYPRSDAFATEAVTADASAPYALTFGSSIAFSETDYGELHTLTVGGTQYGGDTIEFALTVSPSASATVFSALYKVLVTDFGLTGVAPAEATDAVRDPATGRIAFVDGDTRYAIVVTAENACTVEKIGSQKKLRTEDEAFELTFMIDDDGLPTSVVSLATKETNAQTGYVSYLEREVLTATTEGNVITLTYSPTTGQTDTVAFTYDAAQGLSYTVLRHEAHYGNINLYHDGVFCFGEVIVVFGDDCKILEVSYVALNDGLGGASAPKEPKAFTYVLNDDGTATVTVTESGLKFRLTVTETDGIFSLAGDVIG